MIYRTGLIALMIAILGGCSAADEEDGKSSQDRGVYERRNTAPDPADIGLAPRRAEQAYARIALNCINKQYPNKISHVLNSAADVAEPEKLTPVFYGCYDWHSAVHGHWLLTRLWGQDLVPEMDEEIAAALAANFTTEKIAGEIAYFNGDDRKAFERPYGIAWFLQLTTELREIADGEGGKAEQAKVWLTRLEPLESVIVGNIKGWLPKLAYPIRLGTHNQSAFALGLFLDWADRSGDDEMASLVRNKALGFHSNDQNCPMAYEPSGEDFLSSCLMVADLMRRVMDGDEFASWLSDFLPAIPTDGSDGWLKVGIVNDPTDGKLVHLDGLNLSRAWALEGMASALPVDDQRRASLLASASLHGNSGENSVRTPHYSGSHWLASFATYWRTRRGIDTSGGNPVS
ncbi:DUF2891 domain-containing protein [uncultured Parasphingorhabdus sp.]|uniref:DUF2891 domain-containing protein n=1 Tax=uncultured Parasphingorhabdus sp. TaxID=2709694 RepID=UPI0030D8B456|tara:strand:+ start:49159 stop:50364 length:1206 start_codon:yes stop_codon:yes gene_type:complete